MTSQTLREARKYEETVEKSIAKEERPDFHLCSRVGWMNDPNGLLLLQRHVSSVLPVLSLRIEVGADALGTCGEQRPAALGVPSGCIGAGCAL